ncbi:MAG: ATP-binding cassette domain-containing protein [Clostridiales bacterium]|jgi:ABC-type Fe3+/spermidine/putrescine transport system ATPase subunit|nr:ATP-binding cassette domain-containing protein [Eubacteriales bacterium]MDH7566474.1 ATP-binding cassette domain-containing protein [Clostridiales bacterium]
MKLLLNGVAKNYGDRTVLKIDHMAFEEKKIYAVLGPNGSGKTTLLRLIAGIEKPDFGEILYNGRKAVLPGEIAYMPQKPYMFDVTVLSNVLLGMDKARDRQREAEEALEQVGMRGFMKTRARLLSGGESQRVALARTLVLRRKLVLLDEPASAADIYSTAQIEAYIRMSCARDGSTILFSSHSPSQALRIADEVVFLWDGRVVERGTPEKVLNSPRNVEVKNFLQNWRI